MTYDRSARWRPWSLCALLVVAPSWVRAEPPPSPAPAPSETAGSEPKTESDEDRVRRQIAELIEGKLSPEVDLTSVFQTRLDTTYASELFASESQGDPPKPQETPPSEASSKEPSPYEKFLALTEKERVKIIEAHKSKVEEFRHQAALERNLKKTLSTLQEKKDQLEAYLKGELDPSKDPAPLLVVDLRDFLDVPEEPTTSKTSPSDLEQEVQAVRATLRDLRVRFAGLDAAEKRRLRELHLARRAEQEASKTSAEQKKSDAEQLAAAAAEERDQARQEAEKAKTEAARLEAEETVRLLGIKEAQAKYRLGLAERRTSTEAEREKTLETFRKVRQFLEGNPYEAGRSEQADALYAQLVDELSELRHSFRKSLQKNRSSVTVPRADEEGAWIKDPRSHQLKNLQAQLRKGADELTQQTLEFRQNLEDTIHDDVVVGNELRLALMKELTPAHRAELTGFEGPGVRQASREFQQLKLEAWYYATHVRRALKTSIMDSEPLLLAFVLGKLLALTLVFRFWRRRARGFFDELGTWSRSSDAGPFGSFAAFVAWYGERVRAPLEWLVYLTFFLGILTDLGDFPEVEYIEEIVLWFCLGAVGARLVDAVFARGAKKDDQAALRLSTLRTIAFFGVTVGLLLRLAKLSVGTGAIYSWASVLAAIGTIPLGLILIVWWRPHVLLAAKTHPSPPALIRWAAQHPRGPMSFLSTAAAGALLLWEAFYRAGLRRAAHLEGAQRILAYIFRRELEKHATDRGQETEPLPEEVMVKLKKAIDDHPIVESYGSVELSSVVQAATEHAGVSIIAVVGERGIGKSTFGKRLTETTTGPSLTISCRDAGYPAVIKELARALGCPKGSSEDAVIEAIKDKELVLVWLDDATRLIRPLIGGLRDFDRLGEFARKVGNDVSWILGVSSPAWNYLSRARGGRAVVDAVVRLPRWDEGQIHELCQRTLTTADIELNYEKLTIPRQLDDGAYEEADRTAREFSRLLWDFSDGNPMVALHYLSMSLHFSQGQVQAHLFSPPPTSSLEDLPASIHFVLRSVIQLGLAREADIVRCTGLPGPEVSDALRLSCSRNYLIPVDGRFTVSVEWYRSVTAVLRRQHLLIG